MEKPTPWSNPSCGIYVVHARPTFTCHVSLTVPQRTVMELETTVNVESKSPAHSQLCSSYPSIHVRIIGACEKNATNSHIARRGGVAFHGRFLLGRHRPSLSAGAMALKPPTLSILFRRAPTTVRNPSPPFIIKSLLHAAIIIIAIRTVSLFLFNAVLENSSISGGFAKSLTPFYFLTVRFLFSKWRRRGAAVAAWMGSVGRGTGAGDPPRIRDEDLDEAPGRRRVREIYKDMQLGVDHCLLKLSCYSSVDTTLRTRIRGNKIPDMNGRVAYAILEHKFLVAPLSQMHVVNSRGLEIFTKSWLPEASPMKATVFFCHGYGDTCTFFVEGIAKKLASSGYGVFAMDYPGFGLSDGLHGYIPNFDWLVDDVIEHFSKVKENPEYRDIPSFLFGQSMGGAVALKIAENMVPPWAMKQMLIGLAKVFPKRKLVPQKDIAEMAFKEPKKQQLTSYNFIAYKGKPRLGTALQLLKITEEIGGHLEEEDWKWQQLAMTQHANQQLSRVSLRVSLEKLSILSVLPCERSAISLPLLILHGESDIVTDPSVSKALYEKASSSDKKLLLYKDACHALLEGESDDMIFKVLNDIISWLDEHGTRKVL
ncbi:hypothetical protein ACLOJK_032980 [Asimina triloba]